MAPRRARARSHRLYRRRSRPFEGTLLRALLESGPCQEKTRGLVGRHARQASVLEDREGGETGTIPGSGNAGRSPQPGDGAGSGRRRGQFGKRRTDPCVAQGSAQVACASPVSAVAAKATVCWSRRERRERSSTAASAFVTLWQGWRASVL